MDWGKWSARLAVSIWWLESAFELTGAVLLWSSTDFINVADLHWKAYSPDLHFMGFTLLALMVWQTVSSTTFFYASPSTFRGLLGTYLGFLVSWFGPMISSAVTTDIGSKYHLIVWATLIVGAVSYIARNRNVFLALDKLYPHIAPFFRDRKDRIMKAVGLALMFLFVTWSVWACAFTWFLIYVRPFAPNWLGAVFMGWLAWSMFWRSLVVVAGLSKTFDDEMWSWLQNEQSSTCCHHVLGPLGCPGGWPALSVSSWIVAWQSLWQTVALLFHSVPKLPDNPQHPPLSSGLRQNAAFGPTDILTLSSKDGALTRILDVEPDGSHPPLQIHQADEKNQNQDEKNQNQKEHERNVGHGVQRNVGDGDADEKNQNQKENERNVGDGDGGWGQWVDLVRRHRGELAAENLCREGERGMLKLGINGPPSQFVHTVLNLERHNDWFSAYRRSLVLLELNPQLSYFAKSHVISFLTLWFSIAGAATCVAAYQIRFPALDPSVDYVLITVLQVYLYLAAFVIASTFVAVFASSTYVLLFGMLNEKVDRWKHNRPDLCNETKAVLHRFWFDASFSTN